MDWKILLKPTRQHESLNKGNARSPFLRDVDKITFSSYFRTLQDKTQVYPLSKSSYIRTRLTHSMEVGTVGRSLGNIVGRHIIEKYNIPETFITPLDFGYIIQAAALAHDIGNPPFGHTGEAAICDFYNDFIQYYTCKDIQTTKNKNIVSSNNKILQDKILLNITRNNEDILKHCDDDFYTINKPMFLNFDGNTQGFRIITKLAGNNHEHGLNLTYPVLATYCKYPSLKIDDSYIGSKKIGIFITELEVFNKIKNELKITDHKPGIVARYPLTYLLEAADDICYLTADLCDAFFINIIDFNEIKNLFYELLFSVEVKEFINSTKYIDNSYLDNLKKNFENSISGYKTLDDILKYNKAIKIIESLVSEIINILILITAESFYTHESSILDGSFNNSLLNETSISSYIHNIREVAKKKIYCSQEKINKEISGVTAINAVLKELTNIVVNCYQDNLTKKNKLLNRNFLYNKIKKENPLEYNLQIINDFIVSCTDKHILDIYHFIIGV